MDREYKIEEGDLEIIRGVIVRKADGTAVRNKIPSLPPSPDCFDHGVASKDVVVDRETGIWARIFIPEITTDKNARKLPVVLFIHGGGFCTSDPGVITAVNDCTRVCREAKCVVVASSYRLAPEHRLPAAYDDAYTALLWLQKQSKHQDTTDIEACEPWLKKHADFSRLFLMGQSAGGNIVHQVMVLKPMHDLQPMSVKGLIIEVPAFSAEEVSESEALSINDPILPLANQRAMWLMCLPVGANQDHPYCNIFAPDAPNLSEVPFPRILLVYGGQDVLRTRQMQYYDALKKAGKDVTIVEVPEGKHLFRLNPLLEAENVRVDKAISEFINA